MKIDTQALSQAIEEASVLSNKRNWSKQDERRNAFLLSKISALKAGISSQRFEQEHLNEVERENGLPLTNFDGGLTEEQHIEARGWQQFLKHSRKAGGNHERRDMQEGAAAAISRIGTYTSLGYFVPTGWNDSLVTSMAAHDFLWDEDSVSFFRTPTGAPLPLPIASDTENVATITGEAGSLNSTNIANTSHVTLGAYSFSSPRLVVSQESFQDLTGALSVQKIFRRFAADRLARGVGKYLVNGTGSGQPLGLLQALQNLNVPFITAAGSSSNTGGAETGANSLGTQDFANAFDSLDPAYLASDKVAWALNLKTLGTLMTVLDKYGRPIIDFVNGARTILGIPIKICPSLPNIGASNTPVVLGDWSYFATRLIFDEKTGIQVFREAPGLVEQGNVGLKVFARADCNILWNDTNSPCPFVPIVNHS
jgi:HK97 family phage major capsid protein